MHTSIGPSPGAAKYPQHWLRIGASGRHWVATLRGNVIAQSDAALVVEESGRDPVVYFPPADVSSAQLVASDSVTTCPFKGEAGYYAAELDGVLTDVAWQYPAVYDEVAAMAGYIAFYADRVDIQASDNDAE